VNQGVDPSQASSALQEATDKASRQDRHWQQVSFTLKKAGKGETRIAQKFH
jgi:hypothetical protein